MRMSIPTSRLIRALALLVVMSMTLRFEAIGADGRYVMDEAGDGRFGLAQDGVPALIVVSEQDHEGVRRAVGDLQADLRRVTGSEPLVLVGSLPPQRRFVLVGTLGRSPEVDRLVREGRLDVSAIAGRTESHLIQVVANPFPGVEEVLIVAGSDKRGTIYGIYDLSEEIGVSPWYYWADVPTRHRPDLYVVPGAHTRGEPKVRYRGIFLNNENPSLLGWVNHTFGGFGHEFYEKVFELILRLRGNYLWPAMWGKAFYDDDALNAETADMYGIIIGTTHHEPMARSHVEWERYGEGPWDYARNEQRLRAFWTEGVRRLGDTEATVTLGMRGDGDEPMAEEAEVERLRRIIADQRDIIRTEMGRDPSTVPQLWALYKEVQEYYERGLRPPEDVMILLANDNWGNVRMLPSPADTSRAGGFGMYYHFDYVGGPRNYKWINTVQNARTWEQMKRAYEHGVDQMWLVNVGDLKPMEYPLSFFLELAWDPDAWPAERMEGYGDAWAARIFGRDHAEEIGFLLDEYTRFNSRRKPELLDQDTYSLDHYREFERVVDKYNRLRDRARRLRARLPRELDDAYYQLVMYPVEASANLNELYLTVAKNRRYAAQGRAATNLLAERARELFGRDAELARYYHEEMSGGKWRHMMDQTRIGYTYWQQPDENVMPQVHEIDLPRDAHIGVAVEGSPAWWPAAADVVPRLPRIDVYNGQRRYIDVFNRGRELATVRASTSQPWLVLSDTGGVVEEEVRLWVRVDWDEAPIGDSEAVVAIVREEGEAVEVVVPVRNPASPRPTEVAGFIEGDGYIAMEARSFTRAVGSGDVEWIEIPQMGRTESGMTVLPLTAPVQEVQFDGPRLEYSVVFPTGATTSRATTSGGTSRQIIVHAQFSPTLPYDRSNGFRYGISIDDGPVEVVNIHEGFDEPFWEQWVANNLIVGLSTHVVETPGEHVVNFWLIDPGIVLQRLIVDAGGLRESYLGPPESFRGPRVPRHLAAHLADIASQQPLKQVFRGDFLIGAALNEDQFGVFDARGAALTAHHFNTITNENVLKWEEVHPEPGIFDFEKPDRFVNFGQAHGMFVVGHTLVWHNQTPAWVFEDHDGKRISREALIERMRRHIHTLVGRYRGRVDGWDVVNEALDEDGTLRRSPWMEIIGEEYIELAFRFAHEADPGAELYYNDYGLENTEKRAGAIRLVRNLLDAGIPVSGIGTQSHFRLQGPSVREIEDAIIELGSLGIDVLVTELDVAVLPRSFEYNSADVSRRSAMWEEINPYVDGLPDEIQQSLARRYAEIFDVYRRHSDIIGRVTFWGVSDGDTWLNYWPVEGRTDHPLLFDRDHVPKRAFYAITGSANDPSR